MRFIGNNHALHFGGVTFINRVTLVDYLREEMTRFGKSDDHQAEFLRYVNDVVDQVEQELREELKAKHYHHDLHIPDQPAKAKS